MIPEEIMTLNDMVDYAAEQYSTSHFIEYKTLDGVKSRSFIDLREYSARFASFLESKFGKRKVHVALLGSTSFEWIAAFFGAARNGSVNVPLAINETADMLCKLIDFADVDVLCFTSRRTDAYKAVKDNCSRVKCFVSLDNSSQSDEVINIADIFKKFEAKFDFSVSADDLCAICFTSGTTGFPKGVMTSHQNYVYTARSVHAFLPTKRMMACLPIHHSFCFSGNILKSVLLGRTVCVNDELKNLIADFRLFKPDDIMAVPAIIKSFMMAAINDAKAHPERDFKQSVNEFLGGNMVEIISGGAPLDPALNELYDSTGIRVINGYGMTECSPIIANNSWEFYRYGSVGKPIPCMEFKTVDSELLVRGPSVMKGYYKNEKDTAEAFDADGYLHTGDLVSIDDDGYVFILGRCKNLILLDNGENVSAEFLESKFAAEPMVKECVCYNEGSAVCAEIFPDKDYLAKAGIELNEEEALKLLDRVNEKLASFQHITAYVIRGIPFEHTASNKIKRSSKLGLKGAKRNITPPKTAAEQKVADAVKALLGLNEVSMTDNFFALGGNSLNAMELAVSLNVDAQTVYDNPLIRSLAAAIESESDAFRDKIDGINAMIAETSESTPVEKFKCAFVTGSTGFLGAHILNELLETDMKVYCLVRSKSGFRRNWNYYFGEKECRAELVRGNIEERNLGLTDTAFEKLILEVDTVFHIAANVRHAGDYSDLERTNVGGTKNVIEFCRQANAVMQHTSTVSLHGAATVKQDYCNSVFDETVLDIGQHYADNVYIHSKYCAEQEVIKARTKGLKANIFRIGNLTWRASDGLFQKNENDNGFLHRVHAILKLGMANENMDKYPTDLTPVDECAKGFAALALSGETNGIFHMYNPNFLLTEDIFKRLKKPFRKVSTQETICTLNENLADRDMHVYMFYLIISAKSKNIAMKNELTMKKLKGLGFDWSEPDERYLMLGGHCLNYEPIKLKPMAQSGPLNPIQKITVGNMQDAVIKESEILTGENALEELGKIMRLEDAKKPMVLTFDYALQNESVKRLLDEFDGKTVYTAVQSDPCLSESDRLLELFEMNKNDSVLAIGGGSVLDCAKILALRAGNPWRDVDDIAKLNSSCSPCVPFYAVPTTAGTGSEVTLFAVMTDDEENKKKPFVSDKFLPGVIALDERLTSSVPKASTAFTGIDALSHAVEAYTSDFAPFFEEDREYALKAAKRVFGHLLICINEPDNLQSRFEMQKAAFEAGKSFRRISTAYVHAIAHRIGEYYHVPHGLAIAAFLPGVLKATLPYNAAPLAKMHLYCGFKNEGSTDANARAFIQKIEKLIVDSGIDTSVIKIKSEDLEDIALRAQEEAKLTGGARRFSDEEVKKLVISCLKGE